MLYCKVEERREDKLTKAGSAAGKTHGKAESTAEEVLNDVHGRQVHQPKAKASEQADGEVEDEDRGGNGDLDDCPTQLTLIFTIFYLYLSVVLCITNIKAANMKCTAQGNLLVETWM